MKINRLLIILILMASLIPLVFLANIVIQESSKSLKQQVENQLLSIAITKEERINDIISTSFDLIKLVQSRTNLRELIYAYNINSSTKLQDQIILNIEDLNASIDRFQNILILSNNGTSIASSRNSEIGVNYSEEDFYTKGNISNTIGLFFHDGNGELKVHFSGPLVEENFKIGVVVLEVTSSDFRSITEDYSGLGKTGETILARRTVQGNAEFITNTRFYGSASLNVTIDIKNLKTPIIQSLLKNEIIMDNGIDYRGKKVLAVTRYIEEMDWGLVVKQDKTEALAPIERLQNQIIYVVFITSIILILVAIYISRFISKPIVKLTKMATDISEGNLQTHVEIKSVAEINTLAGTLNLMATNLLNEQIARNKAEKMTIIKEKELQERALELERSNKELELFAYIASHDLQEPLRKVTSFGDRIQQKYAENFDEKGKDYFNRMMDATERMKILINDLLEFSRVKKTHTSYDKVDLNKILLDVVNNLEFQIEKLDAIIVIKELPIIMGNETQMRQVFQNLISNSLKFHTPGVKPHIRIYSQKNIKMNDMDPHNRQEYWNIFVQDNGIGFDTKYMDKIFTIFQRLHGRSEYEGTGIGLAITRKVIEFHNGKIDAISKDGEGATFIITLPTVELAGDLLSM